ncbi:hypothetical protein B0T17DRAFT_511858 [Bombardia bombarda]|uniref:Uncharacterized protein n=1 Tax=Bombardia bombarda TaxID=252184 RepID=A0AA39TK96_9PEZI|nr:hypothetical protein B0T17DRAFT_511858 [Bombardia bombarda]
MASKLWQKLLACSMNGSANVAGSRTAKAEGVDRGNVHSELLFFYSSLDGNTDDGGDYDPASVTSVPNPASDVVEPRTSLTSCGCDGPNTPDVGNYDVGNYDAHKHRNGTLKPWPHSKPFLPTTDARRNCMKLNLAHGTGHDIGSGYGLGGWFETKGTETLSFNRSGKLFFSYESGSLFRSIVQSADLLEYRARSLLEPFSGQGKHQEVGGWDLWILAQCGCGDGKGGSCL